MPLPAKVMLKSHLSRETLDAVGEYLKHFLDQRCSIEHFDGRISIYMRDPAAVRLIKEQFASLIINAQPAY